MDKVTQTGKTVHFGPYDVDLVGQELRKGGIRIRLQPFGTVGRNTLRDYHTNLLNVSLFKTINISENLKIQFHVDFLNALNHPNYSSIDPFVDDAGLFAQSTGFAGPHV